jgi:Dolichyl-phosphate-mannose-protein mannosyltransferase
MSLAPSIDSDASAVAARGFASVDPTERTPPCARPFEWHRLVVSASTFLALWILAIGLSWYDGAFRGEFGGYPDESAHYVTGLMVHDYLATPYYYFSPLKFIENFYVHYPKVAIGHWPPVFYLIEAAWTLLFSTSRASLMFLTGTLTALLAFTIYKVVAKECGGAISLAASLSFIALPLLQTQTGMVMTDVPVALFSLLSAICFGKFLDTEHLTDALWFGFLAAAAIMTKGSGAALVLVPPAAILFTRKWRICLRPALWSSASIVLGICGPWYWLTRHMQDGTWVQPTPTVLYSRDALPFFSSHLVNVLGWGLACVAAVGVVAKFRQKAPAGIWAALAGLFLGNFILCCVVPVGLDDRYLLPALSAAIAFIVAGVAFLGSKLPFQRLKPAILSLLLVCLFATNGFSFPRSTSFGFGNVAQTLTANPRLQDAVILAASDANGEGMLVSEIAMRDRRPAHIVLRASKVLATSDWIGGNYRPFFGTAEEISEYLRSVAVRAVVLDGSVLPDDLQHQKLLRQAITSSKIEWKLLGTYPVWRQGTEYPNALEVYVLEKQVGSGNGVIGMDVFGRRLTVKVAWAQDK